MMSAAATTATRADQHGALPGSSMEVPLSPDLSVLSGDNSPSTTSHPLTHPIDPSSPMSTADFAIKNPANTGNLIANQSATPDMGDKNDKNPVIQPGRPTIPPATDTTATTVGKSTDEPTSDQDMAPDRENEDMGSENDSPATQDSRQPSPDGNNQVTAANEPQAFAPATNATENPTQASDSEGKPTENAEKSTTTDQDPSQTDSTPSQDEELKDPAKNSDEIKRNTTENGRISKKNDGKPAKPPQKKAWTEGSRPLKPMHIEYVRNKGTHSISDNEIDDCLALSRAFQANPDNIDEFVKSIVQTPATKSFTIDMDIGKRFRQVKEYELRRSILKENPGTLWESKFQGIYFTKTSPTTIALTFYDEELMRATIGTALRIGNSEFTVPEYSPHAKLYFI
ncbi:Aste57867_3301 [Aphanomyces stellatus]|uniref:Aste57867_3301 protein n=1 Tax=Aphanomyces stellatus TaxID=120398 RepID=A0A485K9D3_9STRA|nr:hypothetical protein As57867_003291 [Aphanomyces stellatus]VFT80471.1 Aste57867_3301 [Aphanomyces stellatus]